MLPIQSVFEWNRFLDFYAILLHRISSLLRAKREPEKHPLLSRRGRRRVAAPCVCFVPCAALASCRPLPQQLLPVSATGRGRRCCKSHPVGMSNVVAAAALRKGVFNLTRTGIAAELTAASEQRLPPVGGRCHRKVTKRGTADARSSAEGVFLSGPFREKARRRSPQASPSCKTNCNFRCLCSERKRRAFKIKHSKMRAAPRHRG